MPVDLLSTDQAQALYMDLPGSGQIPSLSPQISRITCGALAEGSIVHLVSHDSFGFVMNTVIEDTVPGTDLRDWQAPYNYGGVLVTGPRTPERWAPLAHAARDRGVIAEFHRFHPLNDTASLRRDHTWLDRETVAIPVSSSLGPLSTF